MRPARGGGYVLHIAPEERALVSNLLGELRTLITASEPTPAVERLFPVVYPDHPDHEAEYQRLMRDDLVTSKLAGIESVVELLGRSGRTVRLDDAQLLALMQAVNGIRLVLGTMLDVSEDDDGDPDAVGDEIASPEQHLYGYLSWLLDASVQATTGHGSPGGSTGGGC